MIMVLFYAIIKGAIFISFLLVLLMMIKLNIWIFKENNEKDLCDIAMNRLFKTTLIYVDMFTVLMYICAIDLMFNINDELFCYSANLIFLVIAIYFLNLALILLSYFIKHYFLKRSKK